MIENNEKYIGDIVSIGSEKGIVTGIDDLPDKGITIAKILVENGSTICRPLDELGFTGCHLTEMVFLMRYLHRANFNTENYKN